MATKATSTVSLAHKAVLIATLVLVLISVDITVADTGMCSATWYGSPNGDGSDGGACMFGGRAGGEFGSMIAAVSPPLYQDGAACGKKYQVRCINHDACSPNQTLVTITDYCNDGGQWCGGGRVHFDLSGSAFGKMSLPGQENALRNAGVLTIVYSESVPKMTRHFYANFVPELFAI